MIPALDRISTEFRQKSCSAHHFDTTTDIVFMHFPNFRISFYLVHFFSHQKTLARLDPGWRTASGQSEERCLGFVFEGWPN